MEPSILKSIKKTLGLHPEDDAFDEDVMMHINSVFTTLTQLGIGPAAGFAVESEQTTWSDFLGDDPRYAAAKSFTYLKVRLAFDPPGTSFAIDAMAKLAAEFEWRLNVQHEGEIPTVPVVAP